MKGQIITKTLAELYLKQGHIQEAFEIYQGLAEKDPLDPEIQKRIKELKEHLPPPPSQDFFPPHSKAERIRVLEKWLSNIRRRRIGK